MITFQSLIHQGKIARITVYENNAGGITVMFQSLIHQGKIARRGKRIFFW